MEYSGLEMSTLGKSRSFHSGVMVEFSPCCPAVNTTVLQNLQNYAFLFPRQNYASHKN